MDYNEILYTALSKHYLHNDFTPA